MKRALAAAAAALAAAALSIGPAGAAPSACTQIRDGVLRDSYGRLLEVGYDAYGYNYGARMFNGTYDSSDRVLDGKYFGATGDYVDDKLTMKWSADWLASEDCNGDGRLDRGPDGISRGWTTNHVVGDGSTYFVKIVWVGPGGSLWGQYEIVQEIFNAGEDSVRWHSASPGLGQNDGWTTA